MRKLVNVVLMVVLFILILGLLLAINADVKTSNSDTKTGIANDTIKQDAPKDTPDINLSSDDVPKLVEALKIWKLIDDVELERIGDDRMIAFLVKYKQLEKIRDEYRKTMGSEIENLKKLTESSASDGQINTALASIRKKDSEFHQNETKLLEQLNSNLSPDQQAKFIIFQVNYWREMRKLWRNLKELSELREKKMPHQPEVLDQQK